MKGIGGNISAVIQVKTTTQNDIGEDIPSWADKQTIKGWLDLQSGSAKNTLWNAKIQDSTHVFVADYVPLESGISADQSRMVIGGKHFDILLIDNPMEMETGSQWEFYLRYTGG